MPRSLALIALALIITLTGCTPNDSAPSQSAPPTAEPLFASDDEALAAAEEALTGYWAAVNRSLRTGSMDTADFGKYVTADFLDEETSTLNQVFENGWRQTGEITFDTVTLQQRFVSSEDSNVVITACTDFSKRTMIDAAGKVVTFDGVTDRRMYQITLIAPLEPNASIRITKYEPWETTVCAL